MTGRLNSSSGSSRYRGGAVQKERLLQAEGNRNEEVILNQKKKKLAVYFKVTFFPLGEGSGSPNCAYQAIPDQLIPSLGEPKL